MSFNRNVLFFFVITDYDVQYIVGDSSVGLHLLIPKQVYSTFMTCYGYAVVPCLIIPHSLQMFKCGCVHSISLYMLFFCKTGHAHNVVYCLNIMWCSQHNVVYCLNIMWCIVST